MFDKNAKMCTQVFCSELPVFLREHHNGMYRSDVYFLCKTLAETPIFLAIPVLFTAIVYYIIRLNPGINHFLICILIVVLVSNAATSFGKCYSALSSKSLPAHYFC